MPNWETVADNAVIDINKYLDFRQYDTTTDRDTASASFGSGDIFKICRVVETGYYYYWNGAAWVQFPSAGGYGAPVDASYVTINAEGGLTAETQHKNITGANLHDPKTHTHTESEISDLDHDADKIKGKTVDTPVAGDDGYFLQYDHGNSKFDLASVGGGGDMTKAVYDTDADNVVDNSEKLEGNTLAQVQNHNPIVHKNRHIPGGADPFVLADQLDCISRVAVRKNSATAIGSRRRLNFIEGSGITLTMTDDDSNEEVDINIASSVTANWNSGEASVASGGTIAHGLGGTPTSVVLTAKALQPYALGYNTSATHITVYHNAAGKLTVGWWAKI